MNFEKGLEVPLVEAFQLALGHELVDEVRVSGTLQTEDGELGFECVGLGDG